MFEIYTTALPEDKNPVATTPYVDIATVLARAIVDRYVSHEHPEISEGLSATVMEIDPDGSSHFHSKWVWDQFPTWKMGRDKEQSLGT